jgi:uncharacterized phage protein (predicted DNA packaging)
MAVNLADLKAECRVQHDFEDTLLQRKLDVAKLFVESRIGKSFDDFEDGIPAALDEAVLRIASHLYEHRGVASETALSAIPEGFRDLVNMYRKWTIHSAGCTDDGV